MCPTCCTISSTSWNRLLPRSFSLTAARPMGVRPRAACLCCRTAALLRRRSQDRARVCRTLRLLRQAQGRCVRMGKKKKGRARQMNAGAAVARGDLLCFVHADSRLCRDAIDVVRCARRDYIQRASGSSRECLQPQKLLSCCWLSADTFIYIGRRVLTQARAEQAGDCTRGLCDSDHARGSATPVDDGPLISQDVLHAFLTSAARFRARLAMRVWRRDHVCARQGFSRRVRLRRIARDHGGRRPHRALAPPRVRSSE